MCAAEYFGFQFCDRKDKLCVIANRESGSEEEVEILNVLEFSSKVSIIPNSYH